MEVTEIARKAIENYIEFKRFEPDEKTKEMYGKNGACFIIILKDKKLRGCIGTLNAFQPLYEDIITNAVNAGFRDYRFHPLKKEELSEIKIKVVILSKPKKVTSQNLSLMKFKLKSGLGIILKKGPYSATFLPEVWKSIRDKNKILEKLSIKAGLKKDDWRDSDIYTYKTKVFEENV